MKTIKAKMKMVSNMYLTGQLSAKEYRELFDSLWIELTHYVRGGEIHDTSTKSK